MMRSMYSAVSGLKTHQTRMDVIGNNIANVNTVAFKSCIKQEFLQIILQLLLIFFVLEQLSKQLQCISSSTACSPAE